MKITILGGTGYAGAHIATEALQRGDEVRIVARHYPETQLSGAQYLIGDVTDPEIQQAVVTDTDAVVVALSPRGNMAGLVRPTVAQLAKLATNTRLGVIIGAGSLLVAPQGPTVASGPDFPEAVVAEATEMAAVLDDLRQTSETEWFAFSPAGNFGAHNPGVRTGNITLGEDVLLSDANGESNLSGEDMAAVILDELHTPAHHRQRFTAATI